MCTWLRLYPPPSKKSRSASLLLSKCVLPDQPLRFKCSWCLNNWQYYRSYYSWWVRLDHGIQCRKNYRWGVKSSKDKHKVKIFGFVYELRWYFFANWELIDLLPKTKWVVRNKNLHWSGQNLRIKTTKNKANSTWTQSELFFNALRKFIHQ